MPRGSRVDTIVRKTAASVTPRRAGQTKTGAAIAIQKSRGVLKQKGGHLALGPRARRGL